MGIALFLARYSGMRDPSAFWYFDVMVLLKPKWNFNSQNDNASLVADPMAVHGNLHFQPLVER